MVSYRKTGSGTYFPVRDRGHNRPEASAIPTDEPRKVVTEILEGGNGREKDPLPYKNPGMVRCPQILYRRTTKYTERVVVYQADAASCNACPIKGKCTLSDRGRILHRSFDEEYLDRVRGYHRTEAYRKAMRKRQVWVEPLFGEGKQWHGLSRFRLRRLRRVNIEAQLVATGQNLKRLLSWSGWGKRHFPGGAAGVPVAHVLHQCA